MQDVMHVESANASAASGMAISDTPTKFPTGWPGLERSDYPGGVSHKKSCEMLQSRWEVVCGQVILQLAEFSLPNTVHLPVASKRLVPAAHR